MAKAAQWEFTDGWILMSVYLAAKAEGAPLHRVLAAADALNHAIPTPDELSASLSRLVAANVVEVRRGHFAIHSDHLSAIQDAYAGRGGLFSVPDKGCRWLRRAKIVRVEGASGVAVSEPDHEAAYERYLEMSTG